MKVIIDVAEPFDQGMLLIAVTARNDNGGVTMANHVYDLAKNDLLALGIGDKSTDPSSPKELRELAAQIMKEAGDTEELNRILEAEG